MPTRWPWLWWWRLPWALGMAIIGFSLPDDPHAFSTPVFDHGAFLVAAALLFVASLTPTRDLTIRIAAMGAVVLACGGRAAVVVLTSSSLTNSQIITGMTVWTLVAAAIIVLTVAFDRLRSLGG